ncbi:hypothetical protein K6119_11215 [Paracrocinitomix mangrovi]|uniref:hypothetical protein n=1 Tax=Paracrocinitomix mangrovi TaxID=2862509 RepID=UPI001C8D5D9E|nr:hypothetical protein [Paracrocinitomix mangrovi]UKN00303.1 hypothetical protein K6119_11215 [Paracrocinitomix mangrovi]
MTEKKDLSIYTICMGNFERSVIWDKCEAKFSRIFKEPELFPQIFAEFRINNNEEELPICCCKIDDKNWSLLTTRKLFTSKAGIINIIDMETAQLDSYRNPHNFNEPYTLGLLITHDGNDHEFFIENGYCCQVMVSAIHERLILQKNSEEENQRKIKMLIRRGFLEEN